MKKGPAIQLRYQKPLLLMDITKILSELRSEKNRLSEAIALLERIQGGKRRGQPPKRMKERAENSSAASSKLAVPLRTLEMMQSSQESDRAGR